LAAGLQKQQAAHCAVFRYPTSVLSALIEIGGREDVHDNLMAPLELDVSKAGPLPAGGRKSLSAKGCISQEGGRGEE